MVSGMDIMFNACVVMAFVGQVLNYWLLGKGILNRYVFLFVLGCFIVTESMLALERPAMVLYVLLNLWGVYCLYRKGSGCVPT
jgi:hypothetical protein